MLPQCGFSYPRLDSGQTAGDWARLLAPLPRPQLPRLLLAGEHTSRRHASTVHGARDTGIAQAETILQWSRGGDTPTGGSKLLSNLMKFIKTFAK